MPIRIRNRFEALCSRTWTCQRAVVTLCEKTSSIKRWCIDGGPISDLHECFTIAVDHCDADRVSIDTTRGITSSRNAMLINASATNLFTNPTLARTTVQPVVDSPRGVTPHRRIWVIGPTLGLGKISVQGVPHSMYKMCGIDFSRSTTLLVWACQRYSRPTWASPHSLTVCPASRSAE